MNRIYLDHAATTPMRREVIEAMQPYLSQYFGNPSSLHHFGKEAANAINDAREKVAQMLTARPDEIVFVSGGTESDNLAVLGVAYANRDRGKHIITTQIEHYAVLEPCRFLEREGWRVTYLPVDRSGMVDPEDVREAITDETVLISVMHANNEIGTLQPLKEIGILAKERGAYFHTDAVQTFSHIPIQVDEIHADLLSFSGHKFYGPKGVGGLYVRKGTAITPYLHGGYQEFRLRAGTENVAGIMGVGKAAQLATLEMDAQTAYITALRDRLVKSLLEIEGVRLNGHPSQRLPNNINITAELVDGEAMLINLDFKGIAVSTGSTCTAASKGPSHVLTAIGLSYEDARSALRITLGKDNTEQEIEYFLEVFKDVLSNLRKMSPVYQERKR
ncbi:MAG TPA: cysteine desulfurase NifS [Nitrospirota bacterium]|nr:cysteine desulfurase NifS [Nitrospirota bacterium]